jgi:hypothetical protein
MTSQKSKVPQCGHHLMRVCDALDHMPRMPHRTLLDHDPLEVRAKRPEPGKTGPDRVRSGTSHCHSHAHVTL